MKVAIVHDDFIQHGGAEKLVVAMLELSPNATLYSAYFTNEWKISLAEQFPNAKFISTWMQKLPFMSKFYKLYALFFPLAIESINLNGFDLVLTSSARYAHGVITKPSTTHIAYVNSPGRMWWEEHDYFGKTFKNIRKPILHILRQWDFSASKRADYIIANSTSTAKKIKKYWDRKSIIIYPFYKHNVSLDSVSASKQNNNEYYLVVSRLEEWKNIEIAIKACEKLKRKLLIVGSGSDFNRLENISNSDFITFVGRVSDEKLYNIYRGSKALIMTQKEDFGITSIEAQSFGKPVIAYGKGGVLDTIQLNKTGIFFDEATTESLSLCIQDFEKMTFDPNQCILNARTFTEDVFKDRLLSFINKHVKTQ